MMTTPKQNSSEVLRALAFPNAGDDLNGTKVVSSKHSFQKDSILRYQIVFPKGTKAKEVPSLLKTFFNTQLLEGEHNMMVKHHDYTVKPHEGNVAVVGAMHIVPIAYANPGAVEFDEDYSKMEMSNPETYFRRFDVKGFSGSQFRAKLFSLVSYMGENYGYCDGDCLYHRRASLIMPKIKITKAVKNAKMMYHTHPKKDEPSLSSADDYLLYFDLSHEPRNVRDFYTVMDDRMDYFKITPKKGSKENYLKLSEDKFLDEVNAKMEELEVKWTKKIPKEGATPQDDLEFCEGITKDLVAWMNKKYGKFFTIKYKCYYKVRQNPPAPESQDLHLNDEFLKKALVEVNSGDYSWPEFKADAQPHENYAYWHQRYYTEHVRDSFMTLGVNVTGNNTRRQNRYFQSRFGQSIIANIDALNVLNLSYDISKADGKIRDGTGYMSRLDDLCDYLELSGEVCDDLKLLEQIIHSGDVFSENAKTLAGDYYALVLLSFYSIQAVEIMKRVNSNEMDFEKAKYEVYSQLKQQVGGELDSFLVKTVELPERGFVAAPVDTASNPPVYFNKVEAYTNYPPEAFELADILVDAFDEPGNSFNPERVDIKKKMFGAKQMVLYVPTEQGRVTVMIYRSTGRAQMQGPSMEACAEAAKKINQQLYKYGARGVNFDDEFDISEKSYAKNPSKAQVITISGPNGSGKSNMIRTLLKMLPNSKTAPTVTTRQKRKSDKPGERIFVTPEKFKKMSAAGELIAVQLQNSGNYYGRRKEDFENASYVIVDVSLKGVQQIKSVFPGTFTIFLEPVEDPETIRQRILRRGDISAQEAAGRASIIPQMIAASKKMEFDARIQTQQGKFDYAAQQAYELIPKKNPDHDSGKLTDLHMLAKYTVEELENDNDLPTVAECAASVTKENYIGGGAFGKVFRVPGTDYLFKVNRRHDEKLFGELIKYLDGKSKTFTYPTEGVTRYRVDYRIPFECGQPRAWLRREGGGSEPDTIMNNLEGFTIASKIPQARFAKGDKARFKADRGEAPYYPADKIKEYYKWVEEVSKIPQESINQTVSEMQYLISRGVPQDVHSGNMIYNLKTKKITITDWFWDEKAVGRSVMTNAPTLTGIFERVCMINWVRTMQMYFEQHGKKPVQKEAAEAFKAGIGKAMRQALEYFEKCLKAFEANNVSPSKTDHQDSFFSMYKYETETYVDMIRRVLSEGFTEYWYDFDQVQRADAVAISNPDSVPKKQITLDVGETLEERAERDKRLAENKKEIEEEEARLAAEIAERAAKFKQTELPKDNPKRDKPTLEEFRKWVELVNMKNKELKAFYESDWFAASGLTPKEAKAQGIKSGQDSFRAIIRMRKKLGLTGPKDYIKEGPQITKKYYEMALEEWTGPDNKVSALDDRSDWGWMKRQIRFNGRASAFPYNAAQEKRKGPLVKKQKTQNQPSRKLLSLWVWGHDPWRWARKHGVSNMPKCPDVPWVGMTEKRKYGKIPVIMGPRSNPGHYKDRRVIKEKLKDSFNPFAKGAAKQAKQMAFNTLRLDTDTPRYRLTNGRLYYLIMTRSPPLVVTTHAIYRYFERFQDTLTGEARGVADRMRSLTVTAGEIGPRNEETDRLFGEGLSVLARAGYHINSNLAVVRESYYAGLKYNKIVSYYRGGRKNPGHDPIEAEARRAASDPSFVHHEWYIEHHLDYVMAIAKAIVSSDEPEDQQLIHDMVWMHDYPKMMGDKENFELVRELVSKHRSERYTDRLMNQLRWMEEIKSPDWSGGTTTIAAVMSTADALAHYYGPFWQIYMDENKDKDLDYLKESNAEKLEKDKRKLRAGPRKDALDGVSFQYKGRKVRVVGNDHIADLVKKKNPPSKTPEGRKIPKRYLKGLNKEEMIIAAKEIDKGYKYDINDPKAYEFWKSDIKATARGYKTVPSKYKKKFIKLYGPLPEKGSFIEKMSKATGIKKSILQKVYDKGLAAWRGGHRPGVQQHQWAAGRVYSFVTLGNTVKKGNKKMPDYSLAVEAGLLKENPPTFVHADKSEKWSERYEKITSMSGEELIDLANQMAEERGLKIKVEVIDADFKKMTSQRKNFPLPPKYEKLYKEWIESRKGVNIRLYRGTTLIDKLEFAVIYNKPTELLSYIENRTRWGKERRVLPHFANIVKGKDGKPRAVIKRYVSLAMKQNKARIPFAAGGAGGYEMTEGQMSKGYYGIIKTMHAGILESANLEHFGLGQGPLRVDLYQSYGWLSSYSYKQNAPYGSKAAEYYLSLDSKKRPDKYADYWDIYRPVYTRKNPKEVDAFVLVNGSRQGAINWIRDNKWEYGFDDDAINMVEKDERIPTRLVQWFVREASKGNIDLYEDTEEALSNWEFLKDSLGDQTVVNHIKKEYEIKTPNNPLLYSSKDLNGIANWYHSLFEKPALPDDYFALLDKFPNGSELVGQTKDWIVIKLTTVNATVAFTNVRNNSWCVKQAEYARQYLLGVDPYDDYGDYDDVNYDKDWDNEVAEDEDALYLILKASGAQYALFHYETQSFLDVNDEPFPIPPSLDNLMEEVTGTSVKGAIYSDPKAAYNYALELGERFKEGEEAILTSPEYACDYAYHILGRRWPRAEAVIATDGEAAAKYAIYVTEKRWTEFADTVTAQIAEGAISIDPEAAAAYAKEFFGGRWKPAEDNMANDPTSAVRYARDVIEGPWREAEKTIAKDGRASYSYAREVLKGRFELGEKKMFYYYGFHSVHPAVTPSESISYAGLAQERIPELEEAIIGKAWGNRQVMESRYEYKTHAAIAVDYAIAVDVGRIPELEEVIAKEAPESFMYASYLDQPFPRGEEAMLETQKLFAEDGWWPGAVAAAYENRFYNGNWPRLRRKLEEYKRKYEDEMKFPGMGSIEHLFAEKSPEKQFINNYYEAKGARENPGEWRHGEFAEEDPFEEYF